MDSIPPESTTVQLLAPIEAACQQLPALPADLRDCSAAALLLETAASCIWTNRPDPSLLQQLEHFDVPPEEAASMARSLVVLVTRLATARRAA